MHTVVNMKVLHKSVYYFCILPDTLLFYAVMFVCLQRMLLLSVNASHIGTVGKKQYALTLTLTNLRVFSREEGGCSYTNAN